MSEFDEPLDVQIFRLAWVAVRLSREGDTIWSSSSSLDEVTSMADPPVWVSSSCDSNRMARRASAPLSSSLSYKGLFRRAALFFLGDLVRLRLVVDFRLEVGGPIFGSTVCVGFVEDLAVDSVDVVAFGGFDRVLAVGWGFAVGFAMEADLAFMNPASVGWCSGDDWVSLETFLRGMIFVECGNQERDQISKKERCEMKNDTTDSSRGFPNERDMIT